MDSRASATWLKARAANRQGFYWPLLLFLLVLIVTAVSVVAIERAEAESRRVELERNLTEISSALQRRITENRAILRAGAALFESESEITFERFRQFGEEIRENGNLYGSLGLGWAPVIQLDELSEFELGTSEGNDIDYLVYPRPVRQNQTLVPVLYLVPGTANNRQALGFDMFSEPVRRAAIEEAMATDRPVATGKIRLMQDSSGETPNGFILYAPVRGGPLGRDIKGFVYIPVRADEFLESATELLDVQFDLAIYDEALNEDRLLAKRTIAGTSGETMQRRIDVSERTWVVEVSEKRSDELSLLGQVTLVFGVVTALLALFIGLLVARRAVADEKFVQQLASQSAIRDSLTRELNHRVKNTLANVLSIASLTRARSKDIDDFFESLTARIRALSATHDLLSEKDWREANMREVVASEIAPYRAGEDAKVVLDGPDIALAPNDALSLGLALHELSTNAAKYGALSVNDGMIHVTWKRLSPTLAELHWREEGGPRVEEPSRRGFGRDLIEKVVAQELRSEVFLQFKPEGVECTLQVPIRKASEFQLRAETGRAPAAAKA